MTTERRWWKCAETGRLLAERPELEFEWVWVDVHEPDDITLRKLASEFDLDEMAIEDALDADLFPSQEDFGDFFSVALGSSPPPSSRPKRHPCSHSSASGSS